VNTATGGGNYHLVGSLKREKGVGGGVSGRFQSVRDLGGERRPIPPQDRNGGKKRENIKEGLRKLWGGIADTRIDMPFCILARQWVRPIWHQLFFMIPLAFKKGQAQGQRNGRDLKGSGLEQLHQ